MSILIRDAQAQDANDLEILALQLDYSVKAEDIQKRLNRLKAKHDQKVIVAVDERDIVVGWTTVRIAEHIHDEPYAEVSGFVVEQKSRGKGIGRKLMDEVEKWTKENGLSTIRLSANVTRKDAHNFYEGIGFKIIKEQYAFKKELNP